MKHLCVYCGSQTGSHPRYAELAKSLGESLVGRHIALVYGGGSIGLMGVLAQTMLGRGGRVIGVIPHLLKNLEIAQHDCTELIACDSMAGRKAIMANRSDAFLALPGGYGTLDELFESLTEAQLGIHRKPIGLLNAFGFFDPLIAWIDRAEDEGFLKAKYGLRPPSRKPLMIVEREVEAVLDRLMAVDEHSNME